MLDWLPICLFILILLALNVHLLSLSWRNSVLGRKTGGEKKELFTGVSGWFFLGFLDLSVSFYEFLTSKNPSWTKTIAPFFFSKDGITWNLFPLVGYVFILIGVVQVIRKLMSRV
jgi:hypothetical protein